MTLAPIRGAPPGAAVPDFPAAESDAELLATTAPSAVPQQRPLPEGRRPYTPVEISDEAVTLTFRVIPEQPAISRASMTIHVVGCTAGPAGNAIGFLRMSAGDARKFLTDLLAARSPVIARGDEDGTLEIRFESSDAGRFVSVRKLIEPSACCHLTIDPASDFHHAVDQLSSDLGD